MHNWEIDYVMTSDTSYGSGKQAILITKKLNLMTWTDSKKNREKHIILWHIWGYSCIVKYSAQL